MDEFKINFGEVKLNKESIEKTIDNQIIEVNNTYYNKLMKALNNSKGEFVEKIKRQVEEEYKAVSELALLYKGILEYVQEISNEAEILDRMSAVTKIYLEK